MKKAIIAITLSSYVVINAIIVYVLVANIFFELYNVLGESENFTVNDDDNKTTTTNNTQQVLETQCKSPCPPNAEMCIEMCA
ncbi:MAG TPA: hypothetical protein VJ583_09315 [Nitrososphaeraceae archaeon]|nr:hypothetical protein [Nitrososphaeraceae archaeon]